MGAGYTDLSNTIYVLWVNILNWMMYFDFSTPVIIYTNALNPRHVNRS